MDYKHWVDENAAKNLLPTLVPERAYMEKGRFFNIGFGKSSRRWTLMTTTMTTSPLRLLNFIDAIELSVPFCLCLKRLSFL